MFRISYFTILIILGLTVLFHLLILAGLFPSDIVWGGRLANKNELYIMESISLLMNAAFIFIVLGKGGVLRIGLHPRFYTVGIWIMAALFILNTVGNIFSLNEMEKLVFTPVTFVLAVGCIILNVSSKKQPG